MRDIREVRAYIDGHRQRRQSNKVLHGHPSPVFWLDRDVPVPAVLRGHRPAAPGVRKRINLYVGTPYCLPTDPGRCGFCLFPTEVYRDRRQLDTYLGYLRREGELFRPYLEVGALMPPAWLASRRGGQAAFELRRNGRIVAVACAGPEGAGALLRFPPRWRPPALRDTCYSLHDAATGAGLAAVIAPSYRQARRIAGAVERRPGPEVRGWVLDPGRPEQVRRVAIHLDGRLRAVVAAGTRRDDVARWKGTGGRHGFVWRLPAAAAADGTRIDVFDADTGRPLRGSPLRVKDGRTFG